MENFQKWNKKKQYWKWVPLLEMGMPFQYW
jgi:hypothetical protein